MPERLRGQYLAGVLAVAFTLFYFAAQSWGRGQVLVSTDVLFMVVSGSCALLGLLAVRELGFRGKFGFVQLGLFLAVFLWFLGETGWGIYEIFLHVEVPYPSLADVFYLAGYLPAAVGMMQFLWFFRKPFTPRRLAVVFLSGLVIVGASWVVLYAPLTESADILTKMMDVGYPVLDVLLIVLAIMMAMAFADGSISKAWLWIAVGLLLNAVGDIAFSYGTLMGWYYSGHPMELLYLWGYLSLGLGFAQQAKAFGAN